ncbi:ABC-F family ATP-binding cassette domain-containing protein [Plantactinospora soyae]|uniref:ATPase subunit of ABC transporter with duplicated ATPase domains n=1 Tax=Plantactinospora soyae TaxID=1544732 RepID=A0A927R2K0_9ACTN|nr:ABC-F family ATP-binding cassette domain-containing protein [Plantactinospora soyae]MBE1490858.1 ATPase subunit of ABC transporter with duplicated ATPase domains [Plantactinospora soyae]
MLKAFSLAKRHDGDALFASLNLVLDRGDRIGLVGPNGSGKSTLLRVLAGIEPPSAGQVARSPDITIGYFAQQTPDPQLRVGDFLAEGMGELVAVTNRLDALREQMSSGATDQGLFTEYGDLDDRWTQLTGWQAPTWLAQVRQRLDVEHIPDAATLGEVSGGEQARLTLARVLLESPQLLLLDEPTNHLDADGIAWLGDWLARFPGGVLVASHDRDFLDRAVTRIVELDGIHEEPQFYTGGYTDYRAEKARRWARLLSDYEAQEKDRRRWEEDIGRTKAQAREVEEGGVKRGRDQQNRYAKKVAKKAKARERRLRRQMLAARWLAEPQTRPPLVLAFPAVAPDDDTSAPQDGPADGIGSTTAATAPVPPDVPVLQVTGLTVALGGRTVLRDVDLTVGGGDRILVSGRNGAGKSTLLRVFAGRLTPDGGQLSGRGLLLPQTHDTVRSDVRVFDYFRSRVPVYAEDAERLLEGYLFGPDQLRRPLRALSAGELRRLLLAIMANSPARVLLLDEPTNFLDLDALDVTERALAEFRGTLLVVTHDARFAAAIGCARRWEVADGRVTEV